MRPYEEIERARNILRENTRPGQYDDEGNLYVRGGFTKTLYRIGVCGDVTTFRGVHFCVKICQYMPYPDHQLGLALYIQHDERRFLTEANVTSQGCPYLGPYLYLRAFVFTSPLFQSLLIIVLAPIIMLTPFPVKTVLLIIQWGLIINQFLRYRKSARNAR